jgi:hypothetical protein
MFANGFTAELLVELVRAGLASAHPERMVADGRMTEVARGFFKTDVSADSSRARASRSSRRFQHRESYHGL